MPDLRLVGASVALAVAFLVGWWVNGTRWETKYQALVIKQEKMVAAAAEAARLFEMQARQKEQDLQAAVDAERKSKDDKIRSLNSELASALDSLRQRPTRSAPASQVSCPARDPKVAQGATGAELWQEDAVFLRREAARADQIATELQACYSAYEAARKASIAK